MTALADILGLILPFATLILPSILIYLKLMNFITERSIAEGVDINKEKVHYNISKLNNQQIRYNLLIMISNCIIVLFYACSATSKLTRYVFKI